MATITPVTETRFEAHSVEVEKPATVTLELSLQEAAYLSGLTMWWPSNLFTRSGRLDGRPLARSLRGDFSRTTVACVDLTGEELSAPIRRALSTNPDVEQAARELWGPSGHPG